MEEAHRNRPRKHITLSADTLADLEAISKDTNLPNIGVTIDYIVNDWKKFKRAAIRAAAPVEMYIAHPESETRS